MSTRAIRTLAVWCPDWPVAAAGITGEVPAGEVPAGEVPAAVVFAHRVMACSIAARAHGVRRGLRRREAQSRCPELVVVEHDPQRDARAFEPVVAAVEAFGPRVEVVRPGLCAMSTRGPSRYFGGDQELVAKVAAAVSRTCQLGMGVGVGVADGLFAAALAARDSRVVPSGHSARFLASFPVAVLERPELADLLGRLGIHTLGAFAGLPPADVLARFGPEGALAHRLARGLDPRPLQGRAPPLDLVVQVELDPPVERVDTAAFAAKALADDLHQRLAGLGLACTRVAIEAQTEHGETLIRLWRHDGALSASAIAERVRWQLDGWLSGTMGTGAGPCEVPSGGLSLLRLVPDQVVPDHGRQLGFWGAAAGAADAERAARALARVQGMLGPGAVLTARQVGGRGPAEQVELVPWGDAAPCVPQERGGSPPWPGRVPSPSPALVFDTLLEADVVDDQGSPVAVTGRCAVAAPPARLSVGGGSWAEVVAWAGPWPVDERWWDPPAHRRRARFQALTTGGLAWLLTLEGGRWWAEAAYD